MKIKRRAQRSQSYLYIERTCKLEDYRREANAIFRIVYSFAQQQNINVLSTPMSVYPEPANWPHIHFRGGAIVSHDDAKKAGDGIKAGLLPSGTVAEMLHVGSHDKLLNSHRYLWDHLKQCGERPGLPVWDIFLDNPSEVPEDELRTRVFRMVGGDYLT